MRVIVRFSVSGEKDGRLSGVLRKTLEGAGFVLGANTSTYEHVAISKPDLSTVMASFWQQATSAAGPGLIDHVWVYADDPS